jgi:hypothetical protein
VSSYSPKAQLDRGPDQQLRTQLVDPPKTPTTPGSASLRKVRGTGSAEVAAYLLTQSGRRRAQCAEAPLSGQGKSYRRLNLTEPHVIFASEYIRVVNKRPHEGGLNGNNTDTPGSRQKYALISPEFGSLVNLLLPCRRLESRVSEDTYTTMYICIYIYLRSSGFSIRSTGMRSVRE